MSRELAQQAIWNAVVGLDLPAALGFWRSETTNRLRKTQIWDAILHYWPPAEIDFADYCVFLQLFLNLNPLGCSRRHNLLREAASLANYLGLVNDTHPHANSFESQLCNRS